MKKGRFLHTKSFDVSYNLALEHAIMELHEKSDYAITIRIWQNEKSVIIGRGQHLIEEVNQEYCQENNIKINRRISGGGAVFQDDGNWNISLFVNTKDIPIKEKDDIQKLERFFTKTIVRSLEDMRINDLQIENKTNILHEGKKISGAACYKKGNNILHHATLLANTNLTDLNNSLIAKLQHPTDRRASKYRPTKNLDNFSVNQWLKKLTEIISLEFWLPVYTGTISKEEQRLSLELMKIMYQQSSWIKDGRKKLVKGY